MVFILRKWVFKFWAKYYGASGMSAQYAIVTIMPEIPYGILAVCRVILFPVIGKGQRESSPLNRPALPIFGATPA
jgi:hypothetical protein